MKMKFSGSMLLYVVIIVLVVYLLFLRQQGTSGFRSTPANSSAYSRGVNDAKEGRKRNDKIRNKRRIYNEGYDDMQEYNKVTGRLGSSSYGKKTSSQLSARSSKLFARIQRKLAGSSSKTTTSSSPSSKTTTSSNLSSFLGITV